ncbi:integrin alpha-11-like isoform X2 [Denticeps clupeoides]|uniref:VWFA domain-containing protein n=1 Tax=Denticeps clupeoides TaxID=299321 RepID=A0AAY4EEJ4_9TELE|nr:integrin alpha-11 isoform X2 [Denticeps clupeoides]
MEYVYSLLVLTCVTLPDLQHGFNIDTKKPTIIEGAKEAQFGFTVQQHEADGQKWLLVGAPFETSGPHETGDVYKCLMNSSPHPNCTRLNLGNVSMDYVLERKDKVRIGMTLASNPTDQSFVTCGPLWSYECGSSYYSTGICSRVNRTFHFTNNIAPAYQRCELFMDIVIVLDGSNSIYPWYEVQDFLINILQKFYIGPGQIQVGLIQYGERVVYEFSLNDYQSVDEVVAAAQNVIQRGGEETRTALGISKARSQAFKHGGRKGARKVMIVITDGESHDSPDLEKAVEDSERDNITLYGIAVLGYYNRRGIDPEAFLKEIKFIATDPEEHFFSVTDESALKDIVDALGEKIFSLEGTDKNETSFELQMSQAGFSSHIVEDGVLVGAVGAYDWNGAVLKETRHGKVIPPKSSYSEEFPENLKNHGAYLGYTVTSVVSARNNQLYVSGAPRFNHTGKVIVFTLKNDGNLTILHSLKGEQIGSYFGSEITPLDIDGNGVTDFLLVAAPMFLSKGWERGKLYIYKVTEKSQFVLDRTLEVTDEVQNSRFGSALASVPDMNGDLYREVVVGAPLEDDHRGAVYLFHGHMNGIQPKYKQRIGAKDLAPGLQYFGRSVHGTLDVNDDGLVDLAVGSLGAAVLLWSRSVVRIHVSMRFEPTKINIFNKDCNRGGKDVTCMSAIVCLRVTPKTYMPPTQEIALKHTTYINEQRYSPRAVLDYAEGQLQRNVTVVSDSGHCEHVYFFVQETTDYTHPIVFTVEVGLQNPDKGPVLDDEWPTAFQTELPFWNGCEEDERCVPDLVLQGSTDLLDYRQFCDQKQGQGWVTCSQQRLVAGSERVVEAMRKWVLVDACVENRGENAYSTKMNISHSPNLHFSGLILKGNSNTEIECHAEDGHGFHRSCNVSGPYMRSQNKVCFRLEFKFRRPVVLGHVWIQLKATSNGDEFTPEDNIINIFHPLRYEADVLFTRDSNPPRFEIKPEPSRNDHVVGPAFNLSYQLQNLGTFPVENLEVAIDIFAVTNNGNQLLEITSILINQTVDCNKPRSTSLMQASPEDLSHTPQLNQSNSLALSEECRLTVPANADISVTVKGRLHLQTLQAVEFKKLEVVSVASIELNPSSLMFLQEERPTRTIIVEIRKEEDYGIPIWIIIGSTLSGLMLLGLLVLALWKLGFFHRNKREKEKLTEQVLNEKIKQEW